MIELVLLWVKDHWKFVAGITTIVVAFSFGYFRGYSNEHLKFEKHLAEDQAHIELLKAEYERKLAEQQHVTANVTKEYAHAVNELKRYYDSHPTIEWMPASMSTSCNSTVPESTSSIDAGTQSDKVSTAGVTPLDCASDVLQLLYLQKWIREQESIR